MARRARLTAAGFDQPLAIEGFEPGDPGAGKVLIEVGACGVCHRDLIDRGGRFPWLQIPITPGHEAAGTITAVGDGVTEFAVGDRVATLHRDHCGQCEACTAGNTSLCPNALHVFGLIVDGGYATHMTAPEVALYRVPDTLPDAHAAILHCTVGTAFRGLSRWGRVGPGDRVLITGANGGVGAAAIQVAKRLGADVTAVIRDEDHRDFVAQMGADSVVVDPGTTFHKRIAQQPDVVLDCVGTPTFNASLRSMKLGGRLVVVGNVTADRAELNLGRAIVFGLQIFGSSGATREDMENLLALHAERPLDLDALIDRELALDEAEAAQQAVRAGGLKGRIVLRNPAPAPR